MCKMFPLLFILLVTPASCYKILGVFPYAGKSHFDVFQPLMIALADKGHEVTVISHFPLEHKHPRYTDVSIKDANSKSTNVIDVSGIPNTRLVKYLTPYVIGLFAKETCSSLGHPNLKQLLSSDQSFDVILVEQFNTDCFLPLVHHYKSPFIGITSHILMPWSNDRFGNPDNPSYVPIHFLDYTDRMSFIERVENTVMYLFNKVLFYLFVDRPGFRAAIEVFGEDIPDLGDIANNMSLMMTYTHPAISRPRPSPPNHVEIGGLHAEVKKLQRLPQHIEKWINESKAGVIYFSMGSMIKGHTFPEEKRRAFLDAFAKLDQRVLWKWENETMPGKPDNVMIQKWMPQFDILCHPNVKAFVSHGGLLGTTEAVHCGVPTLVMPQFGDQHTNARALEAGGGGVVLNFADVDEESVLKALRTILDPEFNKKAKALSEKFRDRPMSAMDTAIYWIEYVARHKGADHLRTAAVGMPWYQYLLLDVVAFLATVICLFLYVWCQITKALLRVAFRRKEKVKSN